MGAVSPWGFLIMAKKILIISHPLDLHAAAVSFSLKLAGHQVEIWYPSEFPAFQTVTYRIDAQEARLEIGEAEALHHAFDVIWNRRLAAPAMANHLHPADVEAAARQSRWFLEYLPDLLPSARWVNPFASWRRAEYKPLQLRIARQCGFRLAPTLISNSPSRITAFFHQYAGQVVAKPLLPEWREMHNGGIRALHAEALLESHLENVQRLQAMPYVFQRKIDIDYEIRVTVLGCELLAARIARSGNPDVSDLHLDTTTAAWLALPRKLERPCRALMLAMELEFACIDLAVDRSGMVFFLEVNQAGQFLWLDQALPGRNVLRRFCAFLTGNDGAWLDRIRSFPDTLACHEFRDALRHTLRTTRNHEGLLPATAAASLRQS